MRTGGLESRLGVSFLSIMLLTSLLMPLIVSILPASPVSADYEPTDHLVVSEVSPTSKPGEWCEIYNPTDQDISLDGYWIDAYANDYYFSSTDVIKAHGYFLVVGPQFTDDGKNSFAILKKGGTVIDGVGWGSTTVWKEGSAAPAPGYNHSLERKSGPTHEEGMGNGYDTNNNLNDFFVCYSPNPQGPDSPTEPPLVFFSISPEENSGKPEATLVYTVFIRNMGSTDNYVMTVSDTEGWGLTLDDNLFLNVGLEENRTTTLRVTIPADAEDGAADNVTVTATSQTDPTVSGSDTCRAICYIVPRPKRYWEHPTDDQVVMEGRGNLSGSYYDKIPCGRYHEADCPRERSFLRFDLSSIPPDSYIENAYLGVNHPFGVYNEGRWMWVEVWTVENDEWTEETIEWNNQSPKVENLYHEYIDYGGPGVFSPNPWLGTIHGWPGVPVTSYIQSEIADGAASFVLYSPQEDLPPEQNTDVDFTAMEEPEYPEQWPYLEVWYIPEVPPYAVDVLISRSAQAGWLAETLSYDVKITNLGSETDNYDLTVSDTSGWAPTLSQNLLTNVQFRENRWVTLSVTIPEDAVPGAVDTITVTATSQGDKRVSDSEEAIAAAPGAWVAISNSLTIRNYGVGVVGAGENIYIINSDRFQNRFFMCYNTRADEWKYLATPPDNIKNAVAMAWDSSNYIYVLNGAMYGQDAFFFYRYDIGGDSWGRLQDTPHTQGAGDAMCWVPGSALGVGDDNYLYAIVGSYPGSKFYRYSVKDSSWSSELNLLWGSTDDGASLVWAGGSYLYALRGEWEETSPCYDFARYDLINDSWTSMAPIPASPHDGGVGGVGDGGSLLWISGDYIYALSGNQCKPEPIYDNRFYQYTISTDSWERLADLPAGVGNQNGPRLGVVRGKIYCWRGCLGDSVLWVYCHPGMLKAEVSVLPEYQNSIAGGTLEYTVTVTNLGIIDDTYDLTVDDTEEWGPMLDNYSLTVLASENRTTTLTVTIPDDAENCTEDIITVTATSQVSSSNIGSDSCIAHAYIAPEIDISVSPKFKEGLAGTDMEFTITVGNTGNAPDTFDLTASDNEGWGPYIRVSWVSENFPVILDACVGSDSTKPPYGPGYLEVANDPRYYQPPPGYNSYLKFDLSSIPIAMVAEARLHLYSSDMIWVPGDIACHGVDNDAWTDSFEWEDWEGQPGYRPEVLDTVGVGEVDRWYSWDVTSFAQEQVGDLASFCMTGVEVTDVLFASMEKDGFDAYLEVTYVIGDTVPLRPGENTTRTLVVPIPENAVVCTEDNITVTATSRGYEGLSDSDSCAVHVTVYAVDVSVLPEYQENLVGGTLDYEVVIKNMGGFEDNYELTVGDNEGWGLTLDNGSLSIPPGESRMTALTVAIPENAVGCTEDNITVTATSMGYEGLSDSDSCIAHAIPIVRIVDVSISPEYQENIPWPFGELKYEVTVTNEGTVPDTYDLSASDTENWVLGFMRRRPITISGAHPENYQIRIVIPYDSDMRADYGDLRFYEDVGVGELPYWIENYTADNATVWVRRLENEDGTIYVYYGDPNATSKSDGDATFEFFDDFLGTEIDTDKWTVYEGSVDVADSIVTVMEGDKMKTQSEFSYNTKLRGRWRIDYAVRYSQSGFGYNYYKYDPDAIDLFGYKTTGYPFRNYTKKAGSYHYNNFTSEVDTSWHTFEIKRLETSYRAYIDDWDEVSETDTTRIPTVDLPVKFFTRGAGTRYGGSVWADWVFVAKYASPEPTASVGAEEPAVCLFSTGSISPGGNTTVTLTVAIPENAVGCTEDNITVTATSQADPTASDSDSCIAHAIPIVHGVDVSISPAYQENLPWPFGELEYEVTVTNEGNVPDTYDLTVEDIEGWGLSVSPASLEIGVGGSGSATLTVTISENAVGCTEDNITVTATSKADPTVSGSDSCIAHALPIVHIADVSISPDYQENRVGGALEYEVTVTNKGNVPDTFDLSASDTENWALLAPHIFMKRQPITISGAHPEDYQIRVVIPYDSDMRPDYGDLRFYEDAGFGELPYWIENYTADNATVWVRRLENKDDTIYVYYGNPDATSKSDGNATFEFFDDFLGTSIDPSKWTQYGGSVTVVNSEVDLLSGKEATGRLCSNLTFGYSHAFEAKVKFPDWGGDMGYYRTAWAGFERPDGANRVVLGVGYNTSYGSRRQFNTTLDGSGVWSSYMTGLSDPTKYFIAKLIRASDSSNASCELYDLQRNLLDDRTNTERIPTINLNATLGGSNWGSGWPDGRVVCDWIFVCKYADPEPTASVGAEEFSLSPGENTTATLIVWIPEDAVVCTEDNISVTATSKVDPTVTDSDSCIAHAIPVLHIVDVSISPAYQENLPWGILEYEVTVTNEGNVPDNYDLTVEDIEGWGLGVSPASLEIGVGGSGSATLTVTIPEDAVGCTEDNITVTATSKADPTVSGSGSCIAHALPAVRIVDVLISPDYQEGERSDNLAFMVTITNEGNVQVTYHLTASDTEGWSLELSDNLFENIQPGENATLTLTVAIPKDAVLGTEDNITVTATGYGVSGSGSCVASVLPVLRIVDVSISPEYQENFPWPFGELDYTVTVTNEGNVPDNYDLTVEDVEGWGLSVSPASLEVGVGGSQSATLTVTIPEDAVGCTEDNITVTATSRAKPMLSYSDSCVAHAIPIVRIVDVSTSPAYQENLPWSTLEYEVTVTNKSNVPDTYDLFASDDEGWVPGRRRPITISGAHPEDYQIRVVIPYDSDMHPDYGDLRFYEDAGFGELPYWIENYTADNATVWVRRLENKDDTIYVYYGNPDATSKSDGDATFEFFDGFSGDSLDTNKWIDKSSGGTVSVSNGQLLLYSPAHTYSPAIIDSVSSFSLDNMSLEVRRKVHIPSNDPSYYDYTLFAFRHPDGSLTGHEPHIGYYANYQHLRCIIHGSTTEIIENQWQDTWKVHKVIRAGSSWYIYEDGTQKCSGTYTESGSLTIHLESWGIWGATYQYVDWILIRKYASIEPTASVGAEEAEEPACLFSSVFLSPGENATVTLTVSILEDAVPYTEDNITVTATSKADPTATDSDLCIAHALPAVRIVDVSISPENQEDLLWPFGKLDYTVTVKNESNVPVTYHLTASDTEGWGLSISPASLEVGVGGSQSATLTVTISENAVPCMEDNITVTATSKADPTVSDSDSCIAHTIPIVRIVDVSISPAYQENLAGGTLDYTVTVKNAGNVPSDNYDLTVEDIEGWGLELSENLLTDISPSESGTVTLSVTIPLDAEPGTTDNITVTATSQENAGVSGSDSCLAHLQVVHRPSVSVTPSYQEKFSGGVLKYEVLITNMGNVPDNYNLTVGDNEGWDPRFYVGLAPTDDSFVDLRRPDTNYGDLAYMDSSLISGYERISYLKFDLSDIPPGAAIVEAELQVYCEGIIENPAGVVYSEVENDNWGEMVITWNQRPDVGSGIDNTYVDAAGWYSWDITGFVQNEFAGDKALSLGISVLPDSSPDRGSMWTTKESASSPYLMVTYTTEAMPLMSPGESATRDLIVTIPENAVGCTEDNITVTATPQADPTASGSDSCIGHVIPIVHGVEVSITPEHQEGWPSASVEFTVTVYNVGNVWDNYILTPSDDAGWTLKLDDDYLEIPVDGDRETKLTVSIPSKDIVCITDNITIIATAVDAEATGTVTVHVSLPWAGTATFKFENMYTVSVEKDLQIYAGSKLVVKFCTYEDTFENEFVIETFSPPWHVEENENARHPNNIGVKKAVLVLTTDNTEEVISTIATWTTRKTDLIVRMSQIKGKWYLALPSERTALIKEGSIIKGQWELAPS